MVREERRKATKNDAAVRMASMAHEEGRAGVEAAWESSDEFHALWQAKSRDVLAKSEWRKRKLTKRVRASCGASFRVNRARVQADRRDMFCARWPVGRIAGAHASSLM